MSKGRPELYVFPGFGMHSHFHEAPIAELARDLADPLFVDLPEHGPPGGPGVQRPPTLKRPILDSIIQRTVERISDSDRTYVLVGESLGCSTAVRVANAARAEGHGCAALILISPPVAPRPDSVWRWTRASLHDFWSSIHDGIKIDPIYREMIGDEDVRERMMGDPRIVHRAPVEYLAQSLLLSTWLALRGIPSIMEPALVLMGEDDALTSARNAKRLINRLNPGIEVQVLAHAKHGLLWDAHTDEVIQTTREWIEGVLHAGQ